MRIIHLGNKRFLVGGPVKGGVFGKPLEDVMVSRKKPRYAMIEHGKNLMGMSMVV